MHTYSVEDTQIFLGTDIPLHTMQFGSIINKTVKVPSFTAEVEKSMFQFINKPDQSLANLLPPARPQPGLRYVPSQFTFPFEDGGRQYVFNTLTKQLLEGTLPESAVAGEGCDELIAAQFLVPEGKDECALYHSISALIRMYHRKKGYRGYTILPTLACNARCVYCYEEGMQPVTMTPETVEQVIRFIMDTYEDKKVRMTWFGGEPLLCTDVIDRVCASLREAGLSYSSTMISNGSLITPEIIEKMKGPWQLRRIQISMDGAEEDYIRRKCYYTYHDEYHKVMEAVDLVAGAGIPVTIRCNVEEDNWAGIPRFLEDLSAAVTHKEKVGVYFSPLFQVRVGPDDLPMWEKVLSAKELIRAAGFRASAFKQMKLRFRSNYCMADGNGVVIAPDGSLYPCEHCPPEARYGDVWNGTTDEAARTRFRRSDITLEKCRDCPFLPDCTGFVSCPQHDTHCREVHHMMALDTLRQFLNKKKQDASEEPENDVC